MVWSRQEVKGWVDGSLTTDERRLYQISDHKYKKKKKNQEENINSYYQCENTRELTRPSYTNIDVI